MQNSPETTDTALGMASDTASDTALGTGWDMVSGMASDTALGTGWDTVSGTASDTALGTALGKGSDKGFVSFRHNHKGCPGTSTDVMDFGHMKRDVINVN